ncbi:MAG: tRNA lysidine(34) synthetase TilS [Muribaculaceae bacterium]|nr:tRNA lysidine(34) synthetase TilS [Muribaculaceae bacterium]
MKKIFRPHPIETSVKVTAEEHNIKKVLVALSGGADSMATIYALHRSGIYTIALHCNFHLRGKESDRDTLFVKEFCRQNFIPLEIKDFNVETYLNENPGESIEMACRNLRHDWFDKMLKETGFDRIATGHNADDNIETFFLNMLRGSGSRGLRGMIGDNGKIWRPLLSFHRNEILEYLNNNNVKYVIDSTNLESDFRRNFLRNEIIPLLKSKWPGFNASMDKTIKNMEAENNICESYLNDILATSPATLSIDKIIASKAPLLLIKRFIDPYGPFATTPEEILAAIKANKPHIRRWRLKSGGVFLRNGKLFIEMSHGESCS